MLHSKCISVSYGNGCGYHRCTPQKLRLLNECSQWRHRYLKIGQFMKFDDLSEKSSEVMTSGGVAALPELLRLHKNTQALMFFC
ncbi:unnamed protein product [Linum tenue]|uniref:Uncharacterized protein n=1 Tax=Linum tenue TaxID=586396 RepID=A0AAV0R1G2_9ROSI|nr:unnamed protein product [Linum tenue]